jgi:hypothetical protein
MHSTLHRPVPLIGVLLHAATALAVVIVAVNVYKLPAFPLSTLYVRHASLSQPTLQTIVQSRPQQPSCGVTAKRTDVPFPCQSISAFVVWHHADELLPGRCVNWVVRNLDGCGSFGPVRLKRCPHFEFPGHSR